MILVFVIPEFDTPYLYCDSNPALWMQIFVANQGILLDVFHARYGGPTGKVTGLAATPLMVRTTGSAPFVRANPGTTTLI